MIHSHAPALTALGLRNLAVQEWLPEAAEAIGGHGLVSAGATLADVFDGMELAELSAKTVLLAAG